MISRRFDWLRISEPRKSLSMISAAFGNGWTWCFLSCSAWLVLSWLFTSLFFHFPADFPNQTEFIYDARARFISQQTKQERASAKQASKRRERAHAINCNQGDGDECSRGNCQMEIYDSLKRQALLTKLITNLARGGRYTLFLREISCLGYLVTWHFASA